MIHYLLFLRLKLKNYNYEKIRIVCCKTDTKLTDVTDLYDSANQNTCINHFKIL